MSNRSKKNADEDSKHGISKGVLESRWFTLYYYPDLNKYRMFQTYEFGGVEHVVSTKEVDFSEKLKFKRLVLVTGAGIAHQIPRTYLVWTGAEFELSNYFNNERFTPGEWTHRGALFKNVRTVAIVSRSVEHPNLSALGFVPSASVARRKASEKEGSKKEKTPTAKKVAHDSGKTEKPVVLESKPSNSSGKVDVKDGDGPSSVAGESPAVEQDQEADAAKLEADKIKKAKKAAKRAERRKRRNADKADNDNHEPEGHPPSKSDSVDKDEKKTDGDGSETEPEVSSPGSLFYKRLTRLMTPIVVEPLDLGPVAEIRWDDFLQTWKFGDQVSGEGLYGVDFQGTVRALSDRVTVSLALSDGTSRAVAMM